MCFTTANAVCGPSHGYLLLYGCTSLRASDMTCRIYIYRSVHTSKIGQVNEKNLLEYVELLANPSVEILVNKNKKKWLIS